MSPENFYKNLLEIRSLYTDVKEIIILAENLDPDQQVYLAPLNELRNAFDHLMRSLQENEDPEKQFNEAKEHIYRAGYDAYELLNINLAEGIVTSIEKFDTDIISVVFPSYYQDIKPALIEIQVELADTRAHKRTDPDSGIKTFTPYKEKVLTLSDHLKRCQRHIPSLVKEKKRRNKKKFSATVLGIVITILTLVAGSYIYDKFIKDNPSPVKILIHKTNEGAKTTNNQLYQKRQAP